MKKEKINSEEVNANQQEVIQHLTVQLDDHTVITLRRRSSLEKWKERFPKAKIIQK